MTGTWKQLEGQVVNGEFYLRQYLGGSDQSAVFLTELSEPEARKAAIKLIPAEPANAELYLSRLMRSTKLSHPHLMKIYQVGRCQVGLRKQLYIVMECAEENLSQILPERPLTPAEARQMLEPILDVLTYLHGEGFAHGHIKPSNILAVDDQIKISSDGLYPLMNEPSGVLGKPDAYDPPEAAHGKGIPIGGRLGAGYHAGRSTNAACPSAREEGRSGSCSTEDIACAISGDRQELSPCGSATAVHIG